MSAPAAPRRWLDWRILPLAAVTGVILWLLVTRIAGAQAFVRAWREADWAWLPVALGVASANLALGGYRWQLILTSMGHRVPYGRILGAMLATWPLALLVPARAGDVLRSLAIRDRVPPWEGAGSVIAEKAIDVQSLCVLALVGTLGHGYTAWAVSAAGLLLAAWSSLWAVLRYHDAIGRMPLLRRARDKVRMLIVPFRALAADPKRATLAVASSLASWTLAAMLVQAFLEATAAAIPFRMTLSLWPFAVFAGMLPLTVAGMGTRDAAFLFALQATSAATVRGEAVLASTLGYSAVGTWMWALVGIPFAARFALSLQSPSSPGGANG